LSGTLFITGAGISKPAGIPTFEELYEDRRLMYTLTEDCFREYPEKTWKTILDLYSSVEAGSLQPTLSHRAIADFAVDNEVSVVTQNIDELHERAGSRSVEHLHGKADCAYCEHCTATYKFEPSLLAEPPRCDQAGCKERLLHPGVVLFGGFPDAAALKALSQAAIGPPDRLFLIGTNASMPYIQRTVIDIAEAARTDIIEINPQETPVSKFATVYRAPADEVLPELLQ
jgi:NAD-dependent deacetylase